MPDETEFQPIIPANEPPTHPYPDDMPAETTSAADRLRAFEDEKIGPDVVRINGQIERGSGSPFQSLSDEDKATYAALERLIVAEQKLSDANAALAVAENEYAEAEAAVDAFDNPEAPADA